ncbi:hypothetical protein ABZ439_25905 [Streptomyces sp. NPDC005840]|uniref:hypothetical protein n=2 Tax=unclassified Streptomyces TaxID=2593676 RepID=UPI0033DD2F58
MNRDLLNPPADRSSRRAFRADLSAVGGAALLVAVAAVVGTVIERRDGSLFVDWPPLLARWDPHLGPGTPLAVAVAVLVVAHGPRLAERLGRRALACAAWATATAWTFSLALVDGWRTGVAGRLTTRNEYLQVIDRFHDIPAALGDFTRHILLHSPGNWPAHVAGHPPAATVTFVLLDRVGLGGGGWAGVWCVTVGATAPVAVLVAVGRLCGERSARRAAPFLVLAPAAVWAGTSADGYFAAVAAWSVAFLALAVTGYRPRATGFLSGLLLGLTAYLSYGLTLFALIAGAVLLLGHRRTAPLPLVLAGLAVVPAVFTLLGFDWWEGYRLLVTRYHEGAGGVRPYGYWVWANLACAALITGPATVAGLRRAAVTGGGAARRAGGGTGSKSAPPAGDAGAPHPESLRLAVLLAAALLAVLVADLSGMSKAETERIWLPFAMWLLPAGALLASPRGWLAAQAVLALLLNHLLLTGW